jgi:O-antigen/teichoic acid export membrane protein
MIEWLREMWAFARGSFAENAVSVGGGAAIGQVIVLLASPVLTRLYTPEEFGILAVFASIISTLYVSLAGRYELAIPLPASDLDAAALLAIGASIIGIITTAVTLALWVVGDSFLRLTNTPEIIPYWWLLPMGLFGAGAYTLVNFWVIRRRAYRIVARTKIYQNIARVTSQLGLGALGMGSLGLLIGEVMGRVGGIGSFAIYIYRKDLTLLSRVTWLRMREVAERFIRFPLLSAPSALFNKGSLQMPTLLFASLYSAQVAGWFGLGQRLISIPSWLVSEAVQQVYLGESTALLREEPEEFEKLFFKVTGVLVLLSVPPAVGLATLSGYLFPTIFGDEWEQAGLYAQFLSLAFIGQMVASPLSGTLSILERQDIQLVWNVVRFILVASALVAAGIYELSATTAVGLYSAVLFVSYVCLWSLSLYAVRQVV